MKKHLSLLSTAVVLLPLAAIPVSHQMVPWSIAGDPDRPLLPDPSTPYPYPFQERLIVEWENPSHKEYKLQIFAISGEKIRSFTSREDHMTIKRGGLIPGHYFLELNNGRERWVKKITVK